MTTRAKTTTYHACIASLDLPFNESLRLMHSDISQAFYTGIMESGESIVRPNSLCWFHYDPTLPDDMATAFETALLSLYARWDAEIAEYAIERAELDDCLID